MSSEGERDGPGDAPTLGEPVAEVWVGDVCIESYENAVRLVQPKDGDLAPQRVTIPQANADEVANAVRDLADRPQPQPGESR